VKSEEITADIRSINQNQSQSLTHSSAIANSKGINLSTKRKALGTLKEIQHDGGRRQFDFGQTAIYQY